MRAKRGWPRGIVFVAMAALPSLRRNLAFLLCLSAMPCYAQWTKDITCPKGTVYRDLRPYAGRQEFCERMLPGSLSVKDGPYRFWFSEGHPGTQGNYVNGRQVGRWHECDRFGRCGYKDYPLTYPFENERPGFKPEIPVWYEDGHYVFDFASCWSTWVTQTGKEDIDLNIGGTPRCFIAYLPQGSEDGTDGGYLCYVPFSVGKRALRSLDLMHELPKLGLPQFCHVRKPNGEPFMLLDKRFMDVATTSDVQCAAITRDASGRKVLTFTLIPYVSELAAQLAVQQGPLIGRLCMTGDEPVTVLQGDDKPTRFTFRLSSATAEFKKQETCLAKVVSVKASCP